MSGLFFSDINLHGTKNSTTEMPEVRNAAALVCPTIYTGVGKRLHTQLPHPMLGELLDFRRGTLTHKDTNKQTGALSPVCELAGIFEVYVGRTL